MTSVSPGTLAERIRDGSAPVVVDVRPADDFEEWHVPDSENIDVYDVLEADPERAKPAFRGLPRDEEIVTVCGIGVVSRRATDVLREMGYDALTLEDGLAGWSRVHVAAPVPVDVTGTLVQVARPGKGCLSYVLVSDDEAAVFDASQYVGEYEAVLDEHGAELVAVFDTHAHADHLSGGPTLADRFEVPYHLHPADAIDLDAAPVEDGDAFRVGEVAIEAVHTPGHSPGSVTYAVEGQALLTGDTLFHASVGRVELGVAAGTEDTTVERNAETLYESLQRLLDRSGDPFVLPSHDPGSPAPPVTAGLRAVSERTHDLGRDRSAFVSRVVSDVPDLPPNVRRIKRVNAGIDAVEDARRSGLELGPNRCAVE